MLLQSLLLLPLLAIICVLFISPTNESLLRKVGLHLTLGIFYFSLFLWLCFDKAFSRFQFVTQCSWFSFLNLEFCLGIDGISLYFVLLTTFLIPMCLLASWQNVTLQIKNYMVLFLSLEWLLLVIFSTLDILVFFVFFESVLIPMYILIGIWGSRSRKIRAGFYFFLYTLLGSILMLLGILVILEEAKTTNLLVLLNFDFSFEMQVFLWLAFFGSFAIKIPVVPLHIWLPEAHVEAPTTGSVILAGILLKLGTYGLLRFSFPLFPLGTEYFTPLVYTIALVSVIYSSCTTLRQIDLKRIIAYSSVAHMNFALLGMFSGTLQGLAGSVLIMLSHGLVSSALFLCVGVLYDRYHNRLLKYYSGLTAVMPLFAIFFFLLSVSNLALPGTSSFVGELLVLVGAFQQNLLVTLIGSISLIFGAAYSIWLYNRVCFGNLKTQYINIFYDVTYREALLLSIFIILILFMGLYPAFFLENLTPALSGLLIFV